MFSYPNNELKNDLPVFLLLASVDDDSIGRSFTADRHFEEPDHHFFPPLFAEVDFLLRIGVRRVIRRVVEMRGALDHGAGGDHLGLGQGVPQLPVEVVARYAKQDFLFARRIDRTILEILAAEVHVRQEGTSFVSSCSWIFASTW